MATAYPLQWPEGWPRTHANKREGGTKFKGGSGWVDDATAPRGARYIGRQEVTFNSAREKLATEMERLGARNIVLSTNLPLRMDGQPHASAVKVQLEDPGVALYFMLIRLPHTNA